MRGRGPRVNHLDIAPFFRLDAHAEDAWHLLIVERGTLVQRIGSSSFDLAAGSVRISPPGAHQRATYGEHGARCLSIHLDPAMCPGPLADIEVRSTLAWRRWARTISSRLRAGLPLDIGDIETTLVTSISGRDDAESRDTHAPWLAAVRDRVADESARPPSLSDIAAGVGRSRAQVARGFKEAYGCTIGQFARRRRVEHAVSLIRAGAALSDAALAAGFADQSHMHRVVVAHTGLTPARLRPRRATPLQDDAPRAGHDSAC